MIAFLRANGATILVLLVLIAVVAAVILHLIRTHRQGKSSCGCGCADCPSHSACHHKP